MTPEEQAALDAEEAKKKAAEEEEDDLDESTPLGMSDEDFLNMPEPDETPAEDPPAEGDDDDPPAKKDEEDDDDDPEKDDDAGEDPPDTDDGGDDPDKSADDDDPPVKKEGEDDDPPAKDDEKEDDDPPKKDEKEDDPPKKEEAGEIDYKAEYEKITAPFKANGIDIQIKSAEDAIQLMQMGANYHKKMSAIKPSLKTLKLLENNGLLDESKLNFLIDLDKKNPEAIKKLIKESGVDPLDIKPDEESTYTPTNRQVSDTEVDLDEVLGSIEDSPHYAKTLNVVSKDWDKKSQGVIAANPQIIQVINAQMEDGSFDKVTAAITYERSLGRLAGVSDFDAYRQIGQAMYDAGQLGPVKDDNKEPVKKVKPKKSKEAEAKRKQRKKAASPAKKVGDQAGEKTYDPLEMSDDDFKKFDETKAQKLGLK